MLLGDVIYIIEETGSFYKKKKVVALVLLARKRPEWFDSLV